MARRGGKRKGAPGKAYSNRSDMNQPVRVAPGRGYGDRARLEEAQKVIPLPASPGVPAPMPSAPGAGAPAGMPPPGPGPVPVPLDAPSMRPNEPVTAGLPNSPGAGPGVLGVSQPGADVVMQELMALYKVTPSPDLLKVIELRQNGA